MAARIIADIRTDFSDIAAEARHAKSAGFTGQISGLFASGQHKDVKAAAEAAQVALRGVESGAGDPVEACRKCPV